MSLKVSDGLAAAKLNEAVKVLDLESVGPLMIELHNQGQANCVLACEKLDGTQVLTDQDTAVAVEDTTYDGDGSELEFSGETLAELPVVPGSVVISDAASVAPDLIDSDGDGNLYTVDDDEEFAGTIDYFTGALTLAYPTGKAPGTTAEAINAAYAHQASVLIKGGKISYKINNVLQGDTVSVKVACDSRAGCKVRASGVTSWDI